MSRPLVISSLSVEDVRVRVSATKNGAAVNPTSDTVQMAFKQVNAEPSGGDWKTATWETDSTTTPPTYYAKCLVGPAATVTLADGEFAIWVRVVDSPESLVRRVGKLVVS